MRAMRSLMTWSPAGPLALLVVGGLVLSLSACGGDTETVTETIEVEVPGAVVDVSGDVALEVGDTLTLTATTRDGTDASYAWSSSDDTIATVDGGVVTGVAAGTVTISAKGADTGATGSWGLHVFVDEGGGTVAVVLGGGASVKIGETITLHAQTTGGTDASYTWESSDDGVATVADGVVTGVAAGEVTITATGADSGASGSWGVAVLADVPGPDASVTLQGALAVMVGKTTTLTATTADGADASYAWSSSNEAVATVDADGLVTGVAVGEAIISATGADTGAVGKHGLVVVPEPDDFQVPFKTLWEGSGHADTTADAFNHWNEDGEISTSCAKCHSTPGFQDFLGADGSAEGVVDAAAPIGTVITCVACHNAKTLELDSVTFPSGETVTGLGSEARCMQCHQGRESTTSMDEAIAAAEVADDDTVDEDLAFKNIHYFAAGATLFGGLAKGGYQYAGKAYDANFRHVAEADRCTECHDVHTLEVKVEICADCHANVMDVDDLKDVRMAGSAKDYDGDGDASEGIFHEIETLRGTLYSSMQAYAKEVAGAGILYSAGSYPYFFIDTNGNGTEDDGEVNFGNKYATWTARLVRAAYNYQFSLKDPGGFAHNGKYMIQLLFDSIEDLNSKIAAPVDLSAASRIDAGHFAGSEEAWRHWDDDGAVPASCSRCHSAQGLPLYVQTGGTMAQPVSNGLACATCHPTSGDFTVQLAVDEVTFPSGAVIDSGDNTSNLCMTCHQGRQSTVQVNAKVADVPVDEVTPTLSFSNVHYFPAGATLYGTEVKGMYEYDGKVYDRKFTHVAAFLNCNDCHGTHDLEVKVDLCGECHEGVTTKDDLHGVRMAGSFHDYDGDTDVTEGIYMEIDGLRAQLMSAIQLYATDVAAQPIVYGPHNYPYFFKDNNSNGKADPDETNYGNAYKSFSPRLLKAAYNFQYAMKDPGAFTHNAKYVIQVLYDSLEDLSQAVTLDISNLTRNDGAHFNGTADAWRHWDEDGEVSTSCARCHTPTGFSEYAETGAVAEAQPVSSGLTCETCHTGANFASGAPLKAVASVTFPGGVKIDNPGGDTSFLCLQCHQGRTGKGTIDDAIAEMATKPLGFKNVHYLSAGASLYGSAAVVGYEYEGKTYAGKFNHWGGESSQCKYCHEVKGSKHAFEPALVNDCLGCHSEATLGDLSTIRKNRDLDYDGDTDNTEPLADEITGLADLLFAQLQVAATANGTPIVYSPTAYPYFFKDKNGNDLLDPDEGNYGNKFAGWTPALLKAAHNYQISQKEHGSWAHNTNYTAQLLIDSIADLGGDVSGLNRP